MTLFQIPLFKNENKFLKDVGCSIFQCDSSFLSFVFKWFVFISNVNVLCQMRWVQMNRRLKHIISLWKAIEDCMVIATVLVIGISGVL